MVTIAFGTAYMAGCVREPQLALCKAHSALARYLLR